MTTQHQIRMIRNLLSDEMMVTDRMYSSYPDGYDQRVADTNNRLFKNYVRLTFKGVRRNEVARILIDAGLALTMSCAFYCTRAEIARCPGSPVEIFEPERPTGPPVDVKDAFVSLRWLGKLRGRFERMDPRLDRNDDLDEIVRNIRLDGNEESDLLRWE